MKVLFCGFNGFQQFLGLCNSNEKFICESSIIKIIQEGKLDCELSVVSASWSYILIANPQKLFLSGFANGKAAQAITLDTPFKESVVQASCGKESFIVVTAIGQVWEYNTDQGDWKDLSHLFIAEVPDKEPGRIVKVCCGGTLNVALSNFGAAYCIPNVLDCSISIKDIACGKEHGVVLTEEGSVLTWGGGSRGQLGTGELESCETLCEVEALSGLRVVAISVGGWHSAAVTDQGDLYTWGWNKQGQLGFPILHDGKDDGVSVLAVPRVVELHEDMFVEQVSCGASHTIIRLRSGEVYGCGWNKWGQLGMEETKKCSEMTKLMIPSETTIRDLVCGPWSTIFLCK